MIEQGARAEPVRARGGEAPRSVAEAWSAAPNGTSVGDPERELYVLSGGCRSEWNEERNREANGASGADGSRRALPWWGASRA